MTRLAYKPLITLFFILNFYSVRLCIVDCNTKAHCSFKINSTMSRKSRALMDEDAPSVQLIEKPRYVILDNGIIQVTLTKPGGLVVRIQYGGIDNILQTSNPEGDRGYWDLNWTTPGGGDRFDVIYGTKYQVVDATADKVEVSFTRSYNSRQDMVPLNIDKRFVLLRGSSGFYSYAIYEHMAGWPDFDLIQTRIAFKLHKDRFHYMAIADNKQRIMPSPEDREPGNCQTLAYPEAVKLIHPKDPTLQDEVDDKYQYSLDNRENRVHGWICFEPMVGFWVITPSDEFRNGGIVKQNLTSHVGPTCLAMFHSGHYAGEELCPKFRNGEPWKKVFGPVFIYMNSVTLGTTESLWKDAREQMFYEAQSWPYDWPSCQDYTKTEDRAVVSGRLFVQDKYADFQFSPANSAYLGLALPGETGSWQTESKGYQFWTQADEDGSFLIRNVIPGEYDLYGWVPGVLGDYKKGGSLTIQPGSSIDLGDLVFEPQRYGKTIWEIGTPDRTARKFFIPDPDPQYVNRLYIDHPEKYRQYGLWLRYSEIYQNGDLVYDVGTSDWSTGWFFAHVGRIKDDGSVQPTTWQVRFQLESVDKAGQHKLRLAFAAANFAAIQVRFNDPNIRVPHFDTLQFGRDNAIARHGIHGLHYTFDVDVSPNWLHEGQNVMYLTQRKTPSPLSGVMYDYLRLEGPDM